MDGKVKDLEEQSTIRPPFFDGSNNSYWNTRMTIVQISCDFDYWKVVLDGHMSCKFER